MKRTIEDFRNYSDRLKYIILSIYGFLEVNVSSGNYEGLDWSVDGVSWVYRRLFGSNDNLNFAEIFMENLDVIKEFYNEQEKVKK